MASHPKTTATTLPKDILALSYEQALVELDALIARLERGSIPLDEAVATYERGSQLVKHCSALLHATEEKITQLTEDDADTTPVTPFRVHEEVGEDDDVPPMRSDEAQGENDDDIKGLFDDIE